jgi:ABC-type transporter Mla subunit MlaD
MPTDMARQMTRAEKEVEAAADRLGNQTESALAAVAVAAQDYDELETRADRLERAARDLAVALRELADERRRNNENS